MLKITKISATEEKRIAIGMIVSTEFNKLIQPVIKDEYLTNSHIQRICGWCQAYFREYEKAPFMHIKDIFKDESPRLKSAEIEMIDDLLGKLDDQYDAESLNVQYWFETTVDYFRKREIEITVNNISVLSEQGDLEQAEEELRDFQKVTADLSESSIVRPGDLVQMEEIYRQRDEDDKNFFQLPGDLGRYLGNHKRGDVVAYYAAAKRGKSWVLVNNFKNATLQKRKTLFWSIEMTKTEMVPRLLKSYTPMVDGDSGMYPFPVFDCIKNQEGSCHYRESKVIVLDNGEKIDDPNHVVCVKCMKHPKKKTRKMYDFTTYVDEMYREKDDIFSLRKNHKHFQKIFNKYARVSVHPKYTLTYDLMMRDLETLHTKDNWFPDILMLDYIDILGIDSKHDDFRLEDEKWKLLAKVAGATNTLMITVTQANKAGHTAENLDSTHQGGFYGKNRHVNLMVGLNQNSEEKENGIMRFGITEARSQPFIQGKSCYVLQDLATGQSYLDSYYKF